MTMEKIEANINTIKDIVEETKSGDYPILQSARVELAEMLEMLINGLKVSDAPAESEDHLSSFFRRHPGALIEAKIALAAMGLRFLNTQIDHFSIIKSERPLSEDEKRYGREHLIPMAESVSQL